MPFPVADLLTSGRRTRGPVLLELELSRGLLERTPSDPVGALRSRGMPTLRGVVSRLHEAASDPRVAGLIAHLGGESLSPAQADELADAVEAFGATGRPTVAYAESFGELSGGTLSYRLAVAFDTVWMQPSGRLGLTGVALRGVFLRGLLDRWDVQPQIGQRHEYKGAADQLLRQSMSPPQRESLQRVADSVLEVVVAATARRRGLDEAAVRRAVDAAPLGAEEAIGAGLVDRLGYPDEAYAELPGRLAGAGRLSLRYVHRWSRSGPAAAAQRLRARRRPAVAVVSVLGAIGLGRSGGTPLGGPRAGSDTVAAALRAAGRDDDVRGVVLRVVSPGGSYVASDAVRREVLALRATGRPVVASMGTVAASGGYFVAMGCDEVVATPTTVTGSIGVLGGKLAVGAALARQGVGVESVGAGRQATMFGPEDPFDDEQWARVERWLDEVYADFTRKAAGDRGLDLAELEPLARGRVWTGADALSRRLVDRLGGLRLAVERAATRAGVDPDLVRVLALPRTHPLDRLRPPQSSESPAAALPSTSWPAPWWSTTGWSGAGGTGRAGLGAAAETVLTDVWRALGVPVDGILTAPTPFLPR